jgi:hypothetical protein
MTKKICTKCKIPKEVSEFRKNKNSPDGYEFSCKECRKSQQKLSYKEKDWNKRKQEHRRKNIEKNRTYQKKWRNGNREKILQYEIAYSKKYVNKYLLKGAKFRAKQKGLEFSITEDDVFIPQNCPIFGTKLVFERGVGYGNKESQPSLDRIDNKKGYIKGNVWVISSLANNMKSNSTLEQLKIFCENFLKQINNGFNN